MYLLYCDESGSATDERQTYFVLAGVCCFERQTFWIANELDKIAAKFNVADPASIELHGSHMHSGKGIWRAFPKEVRIAAIKEALMVLARSHVSNRIFACIIDKPLLISKGPVDAAFEQLSSRFDHYLARLHKSGEAQRGLIIFDKSIYETSIQSLATDFRTAGHDWGVLRNLSEVPLFLDSKASRLIQLADLVAYSIFRSYEQGDHQFFALIKKKIDTANGKEHGLCEYPPVCSVIVLRS